MFGYVYVTINKINGKKYIGKHKSSVFDNKYCGSGTILKKAILKNGRENFHTDVIRWCKTEAELNESEKNIIDDFNAVESKEYYNIAEGGSGGNTRLGMTEQQKEEYNRKLSISLKGSNNPMYGRKRRLEGNTTNGYKIWSDRKHPNIGKKMSKKQKIKISEANVGSRNGMYGYKWSESQKSILSESKKGANNPMYGKTGVNNHSSKRVRCVTTGEEFDSCREASNKYNLHHISACCRGVRKSSGRLPSGEKLIWEYI